MRRWITYGKSSRCWPRIALLAMERFINSRVCGWILLPPGGGESGLAIVAGDSAGSPLVARISDRTSDQRMPSENEETLLTAAEITLVRAWIDQGAAGSSSASTRAV